MARDTDPDTSHEAAASALKHAATDRQRCYEALKKAGATGLTDFELGDMVNRQQTSAGKRRLELLRAGFVEPTDQRRRAPSGAWATVWRAKPDVLRNTNP